MLSIVCETRVPSSTGKVSRMRPGAPGQRQGARRLAEAGRQRRRHQHPDHRRRGDVAAADRAVRQGRAGDPVPGRGAEEERGRHQRAGDQDPGEVGADDAFDDIVDADLLGGEDGRARSRGCRRRRGRARRAMRRPRLPARAGAGSSEGSFAAGRRGPPSAGRRPAQWAARSPRRLRPRRRDRPLVDRGHLVGDPRPGVALGAVAGGLAHRPQPLGLVVDALQLLGQALRVGRRHQDAVDPVGDDVAVAGDAGGDRPGCRRRRPRSAPSRSSHRRARGRRGRRPRAAATRGHRRRRGRGRRCGSSARGRRRSGGRPRARRRSPSAGRARARPGRRRR